MLYFGNTAPANEIMSEDRNLLCQIADGDVKSLGILYVLYAAKVRNFAFSLLQDDAEADDVTHDVFLKIWYGRASLRGVVSLKSYLFRIAYNIVLNHVKHEQVCADYAEARKLSGRNQFLPDIEMDARELLRCVADAVEKMSVLRKTIFRLSRDENKTYNEIADMLMISPKTVQYHISCALADLKKLL